MITHTTHTAKRNRVEVAKKNKKLSGTKMWIMDGQTAPSIYQNRMKADRLHRASSSSTSHFTDDGKSVKVNIFCVPPSFTSFFCFMLSHPLSLDKETSQEQTSLRRKREWKRKQQAARENQNKPAGVAQGPSCHPIVLSRFDPTASLFSSSTVPQSPRR
jgi:hypothetical protein